MSAKIILHITYQDKFIPALVEFVNQRFNASNHRFWIMRNDPRHVVPRQPNTRFEADFSTVAEAYLALLRDMYSADKIILHGLFSLKLTALLRVNPWLLSKCYWLIWGGDLYLHEERSLSPRWLFGESIRRPVIRRMGHLLSFLEGDVELARRWYGATGQQHECFGNPANIYKEAPVTSEPHTTLNIQLGNSADPSNNHFELLEHLKPFAKENIRVFAPLSYGGKEHAARVARAGQEIFGEKFTAMTDFLPYERYLKFMGEIDVAMFGHRRQQAMGNTIVLLGLGKTVYLRTDVTSWAKLRSLGIAVRDIEKFDTTVLDRESAENNVAIIKRTFSWEALTAQWAQIFNG